MDEKLEDIKTYFKDSDPAVLQEISNLERSIKQGKLFVNLQEHDAMKLILSFCKNYIRKQEDFLRDQSYEDLAKEEGRLLRARTEAYRDAFRWLYNLFTNAEDNVEKGEKKVENLGKKIKDQSEYGV